MAKKKLSDILRNPKALKAHKIDFNDPSVKELMGEMVAQQKKIREISANTNWNKIYETRITI